MARQPRKYGSYFEAILADIRLFEQGVTVADLCAVTDRRVQTVSKDMTDMERAGLVRRLGVGRSEWTGALATLWGAR